MIQKITIKLLDQWGACDREEGEEYSNANLYILSGGKKYMTPQEVIDSNILIYDKLWLLLRFEILDNGLFDVIRKCRKRSIEYDKRATQTTRNHYLGYSKRRLKSFTKYKKCIGTNQEIDAANKFAIMTTNEAAFIKGYVTRNNFNKAINEERMNQLKDIENVLHHTFNVTE